MEEKRKRDIKLFQYLMLIILFAAAFLLPIYGAKHQEVTSAEGETTDTSADSRGKIVIDPGHGGR